MKKRKKKKRWRMKENFRTYPLSPRTITFSKVLFLCELEISMLEIQNSKALMRSKKEQFFAFFNSK
jgi:hypothetical protein